MLSSAFTKNQQLTRGCQTKLPASEPTAAGLGKQPPSPALRNFMLQSVEAELSPPAILGEILLRHIRREAEQRPPAVDVEHFTG